MKAPFSSYLAGIEQPLQQLIDILSKEYEYVSALATDSPALAAVRRGTQSVTTNSLTAERGIVIRVMNDGHYREYALNTFDPTDVEGTAKRIVSSLAARGRNPFQRLLQVSMRRGRSRMSRMRSFMSPKCSSCLRRRIWTGFSGS